MVKQVSIDGQGCLISEIIVAQIHLTDGSIVFDCLS